MTRHSLLLVAAAAWLGSAAPALAHAHLRSASPAVDGTVATAPSDVEITFSEAVEPAFSSIEVHDGAGKRVDDGKPRSAPADGKILAVGLTALPPGRYTVTWHATAVDTHKTDGTFSFTVTP